MNDCFKYFSKYHPRIKIRRAYCDTLMTSLNMNGFSITILLAENDTILSLLDAKTLAPSWPKAYGKDLLPLKYETTEVRQEALVNDKDKHIQFEKETSDHFESVLRKICQELIASTDLLNKLDLECGDGDCGSSLAKISEAILADIRSGKFDFNYPHKVITHLSTILENGGGSLSILLSLFASASAKAFSLTLTSSVLKGDPLFWIKIWKNFVDLGLSAVTEYGRAKPGQRSIVDPLDSIRIYFGKCVQTADPAGFLMASFLGELEDATKNAVESTSKMQPRVGRASYVDASIIKTPDAGATAIGIIISSIKSSF